MYDVSESFFTLYRQMVMLLDSFKTSTLPHLLQGKSDSVAPDGGQLPMFFGGWVLVVGWCTGTGSMIF